jgi:Bacterial SH3 domain
MSGKLPPPPPHTLPEESHAGPRKAKQRPASPLPPLWSVLLMLVMVFVVAGCWVAVLLALGKGNIPPDRSQPLLTVIAALPSPSPELSERFVTPAALLNLTATPPPVQSVDLIGPTFIPTATITPTAITVAVGTQVIIISQGGVNVHSAPGINTPRNFVANFNQTLTVVDGPERADDLTWWEIRNPNNNQTGWVAENDGLSDLIEVYLP